jgi:hypothetical protein
MHLSPVPTEMELKELEGVYIAIKGDLAQGWGRN